MPTAGIALILPFAGARAETINPAMVLAANRVATGGNAWSSKDTVKLTVDLGGEGLPGTGTSIMDLRNGNSVTRGTMGPKSFAQGFDGKSTWSQGANGAVTIEKGGDALPLAIDTAYQTANLWWRPGFGGATITAKGAKPCGDTTCVVLDVTPKGGLPFQAWFNTQTHLLDRTVQTVGGETSTSIFSDYRTVDGIMVPYKSTFESSYGARYTSTATVTSVAFLPAQPASTYAPPKSSARDFSIAHGAHSSTFPFHLYDNHIYANVWVNGRGPLLFAFDTGGVDALMPETAKALGIRVEGSVAGTGVGKRVVQTGFAKIAALRMGAATLKNQVVAVLPLISKSEEGVDVQGMIGFAVFDHFVTRINYGAHEVTLIKPSHFDPEGAGIPIPFVFSAEKPEVRGTFEGIPAKFIIDTGSRDALFLTRKFSRAHDEHVRHPKGVLTVFGWGTGGAIRGYVTRGKEVTIGPVKMTNVVTAFSMPVGGGLSMSTDFQGDIGAGILKHFVVTLDYATHTLYLKPLKPGPLTNVGSFDRSGMWINAAKGGAQVMAVTAGGPAEQAGIRVGDVITAVDGKPATAIPVYDLRHMLSHDAPATKVHFTVKRGAEAREVEVTLRDQI